MEPDPMFLYFIILTMNDFKSYFKMMFCPAGFSGTSNTWLPVNENHLYLSAAFQNVTLNSHMSVLKALTTLRKETVVQEGTVNVQLLNDDVLPFVRLDQTTIYSDFSGKF